MSQPRSTGTATSRARLARPAVRKQAYARLALSGASGSGKTWTSLSVATKLAADMDNRRILVIDTEPADSGQGAAELYADRFDFDTIQWFPPYDPRDLALTLRDLDPNEYGVVIVDSASHFWRGEGGTLDIAGGKFGGWKTATPAQDDLVDAILRAPMHVIVCTRAKQEYLVEEGNDGKQKVTKLGLAPVQRDDLEYEFQVVAMIDQQHEIEIGKTRCADLAGAKYRANHQDDFAEVYARWLAGGLQLARQTEVDALRAAMNMIPDAKKRQDVKRAWLSSFGDPQQLPADRVPDAWAWLEERGVRPVGPPEERSATAQGEPDSADAAPDDDTPAHDDPEADPGPEEADRRAAIEEWVELLDADGLISEAKALGIKVGRNMPIDTVKSLIVAGAIRSGLDPRTDA